MPLTITSKVTSVASRVGTIVLSAADIGTGTFPGNYVFTGNVTIGNKALWSSTRTMPGSNNTVDLGTFTSTNGAFQINLMLTINASGFAVTKSYEIDVTGSIGTTSTWYKVLPQDATQNSGASTDFTLEVNRNATTNQYTFRIRQVGATGGTLYFQAEGYGDNTIAFTASTATTAAPAAVTTIWAPTPLFTGPGRVGINNDNPTVELDVTGSLKTSGTIASIGNITENGNRVYSLGNLVPVAGLSATGTKDATTYLRGDNTWATIAAGGVTSVATRTGAVVLTAADIASGTFPGTYTSTGAITAPSFISSAGPTFGGTPARGYFDDGSAASIRAPGTGDIYLQSATGPLTRARFGATADITATTLTLTGAMTISSTLVVTGTVTASKLISGATTFGGGDWNLIDGGVSDSTAARFISGGGSIFLQPGTGGTIKIRNATATQVMTIDQSGNINTSGTATASGLVTANGGVTASFLSSTAGISLGASQQTGPGMHSDGSDNVYIEAGSAAHNIYVRPNRTNAGMWQFDANGNAQLYDSGSVNYSSIGPNTAMGYGSLNIGGSKNGWAGIAFSGVAANQIMMAHAASFGVYDGGTSSWRWQFTGASAGTGGEWSLAYGYVPWSRITGVPTFEIASAQISTPKTLSTANGNTALTYYDLPGASITVPANSGAIELQVIGDLHAGLGTGTNAASTAHAMFVRIIDESSNVIWTTAYQIYSTAATNQTWFSPIAVGQTVANNVSAKTYRIQFTSLTHANTATASIYAASTGAGYYDRTFRAVRRA